MKSIPTLETLGPLAGRRVFVRVDFNVPLADARVMDDNRLVQSLPTLRELAAAGARLVLASHCGRPRGERRPELSLFPVAQRLGELLDAEVAFATDCVGAPARDAVEAIGDGEIVLLENLRFHPGEQGNDPAFATALAALAELYVNDAFGTAHRAHASVTGVPTRLTGRAAGRLLVRELEALGHLLGGAEAPFVAVIGGAKIGGKLDTLVNLVPRLDRLLVGGGMANTFLAARGVDMGASLVEHEALEVAHRLLATASEGGVDVVLPTDLVIADGLAEPASIETVTIGDVAAGRMALDVGPATRAAFRDALADARTIFWNGPMGVFETPPFDAGTRSLAAAVADSRAFSVVGGGETVAAVRQAGRVHDIDHVSTGGGASLEFLAGATLPGVAALTEEVPS